MDSILERRSCRKFTEEVVSDELIEKLLRAAMQAPSACDQRPWEFIVVRNKEVLNNLAGATPYSMCVGNSNVAIIPCYKNYDLKKEEYVICDMSACVENILVEATSLRLGAVWIGGAPNGDRINNIRKILNIEDRLVPFCIIPVGYPLNKKDFEDRYEENRVHFI